MRDLRAISAVAVTIGALALGGCAEAENAVRDAANSAASSAASQAAASAQKLARDQLCKVTKDGTISAGESKSLTAAVAAAEAAGVPQELLDAARQVADEGTAAPRQAVTDLQEQCAAA